MEIKLHVQGEDNWTKNKSTTWDNLQAGDTFFLGGLLANVLIHSEVWRNVFIASRPQGMNAPIPTVTSMQIWFVSQPVPRKWAERLVSELQCLT